MTNLFLIVAEQSLRLSGMILFLWVLRTLIRRIPGSALYLLWILVFVGLVLPSGWRCPITLRPRQLPQRPSSPQRSQTMPRRGLRPQ